MISCSLKFFQHSRLSRHGVIGAIPTLMVVCDCYADYGLSLKFVNHSCLILPQMGEATIVKSEVIGAIPLMVVCDCYMDYGLGANVQWTRCSSNNPEPQAGAHAAECEDVMGPGSSPHFVVAEERTRRRS